MARQSPEAQRAKARAHDLERGKDPKRIAAKRVNAAKLYRANKQAVLARSAAHVKAHPDMRRQVHRNWVARNPGVMAAHQKLFRQRHPERHLANTRTAAMRRVQACPAWANAAAMRKVYALARYLTTITGVRHHVDHIVPIRNKIVCGLHCEANLRPLPWRANITKGNRYWPDMPANLLGE